ncbi:RluA family pseudouridine synthase [Paenibacillus sp. sptzw28]|uniref:RluA family pseudouridine synthase n=1 Tax=Paenibacillus sp. sptzw28 TaxID=715179 RepID=UPI001C6EE506|nr:RluA family pseudouridine synthase [Paenibacillus sp. sptzw28]QYR22943.1 RluA family pseudouridine synthase [Paenibacillus sp. sptzw28]
MSDAAYYKPLILEVAAEDDGKTVRTVLERRLGVSRKLLSRLKLTEHGITLNGRRVYTNERVRQGDSLALRMEQEQSDDILPEPMPLDIVYEDPELLIVNKPPGIVVHPTHGHYTGTLANGVVHHWRERGEIVRFRPIHRLDEETSGLVAIAKNPYVHQQLSEQMQSGEVDKRYRAYVYGRPAAASGTVDAPIDRNPEAPHIRIVMPEGYPSVTHYETEAIYGDGAAAKVKLKLETGRTHQIRVHMKYIGCPLIGDKLYGYAAEEGAAEGGSAELEAAVRRQALHAATLGFTHPITRKYIEFEADLPQDLRRLEATLREL